VHHLRKKKNKYQVEVLEEAVPDSQEAILNYSLIGQSDRYFLLKIDLQTGRYHQIRAQLAHIGCPIRGDAKYGFRRRNPDRSIDLHAWQLRFQHPRTGVKEHLIAAPPDNPLWNAFAEELK
jgi:23S rRNA pseudouridine1911/1915/1917 synthase